MAKRPKKGSPAAKAWGRKMARLRAGTTRPKRKSSTTKYKRRTMVKRKTTKRRAKRSTSIMGVNLSKVGAAMLYGAIRSRTSSMIAPYTSKLPLGNVADEAGMFLAAQLAKKFMFKRAGIIRDALTIGQGIEAARVGEAILKGQVGLNIGGGASAPTGNVF